MRGTHILDGRDPVPCDDFMAWAMWFGSADRQVAVDYIGPMRVSTVFMGDGHTLFETMIFDRVGNPAFRRRYSTWGDAERGHAVALRYARRYLKR